MTVPAERYAQWAQAGGRGEPIGRADARAILRGEGVDLAALVQAAGTVRRQYFNHTVSIHVLDNVRNGACPEDCGYCGQSKVSGAPISPYRTKPVDQIVAEAQAAKAAGAFRFCMALSGRGPSDRDIDQLCHAVRRIKAMGLRTCLSFGLIDEAKARRLAEAGLDRLNHNLNTSRRHYPAVCTTHRYDDRLATIRAARSAGLGVCSGVIVGMGETHEDLLDAACELREIRAESIPVNFLLPIPGNPIGDPQCDGSPLDPQFCLRVLCVFRLVNPTAELRLAAGREMHLRCLQAMALWPANSLFVEGYLLTEGDSAADTIRMIHDAGFVPRLDEGRLSEPLMRQIASQPGHRATEATMEVTIRSQVARP